MRALLVAACLYGAPAVATDGCFRMKDQTVTCTPQGFALLASEIAFQTNTVARVTAQNVRLSTDLRAAQSRLAEVESAGVSWPVLLGATGAGVVAGLLAGVLLSR